MAKPLDLKTLPKVDIHRHLEGCIRPRTAYELGRSCGTLPASLSFEDFVAQAVVKRPSPILQVLERFDLFRVGIVNAAAVTRVTAEAVADAAADGVEACELRYSPLTLARVAGLTMAETLAAIQQGLTEDAVTVDLVVVISRRHGTDAAWQVVRHLERDGGGIAGVDFASDELRHSTAEFGDVARALADLGLPLTVHTGEGVGARHVADALALPNVRRLGHAVSLADDPSLVAETRERGVVIEVSLTSNVRTGIVERYAEHPARQLMDQGLKLALCTDDPTLFDIDLTHELGVARSHLGFTDDEILSCQRWAREALFAAGGVST